MTTSIGLSVRLANRDKFTEHPVHKSSFGTHCVMQTVGGYDTALK